MNAYLFCLTLQMMGDTFGSLPEERVNLACEQAAHLIETVEQYNIDPAVFAGLIFYESRWRADAVSRSNACGLTQVLPRYACLLGIRSWKKLCRSYNEICEKV